MRQVPNANKMPEPPKRPQYRNLSKVAKNVQTIPYLIAGEVDEENGRPLLHPDNFVVALAPLMYRSYLNYENKYGETIDVATSKIIYIISKMFNALAGQDDKPIEKDEFDRIVTPFGLIYGSVDRNVVDLCAFILSQTGRITADNGDGSFEYVAITPDDILDVLDNSGNLFMQPDENNVPLLMEVLAVSGLYSMDEALAAQEELEEDDLKNSPSPNVEDAPTKKPSKKGPKTGTR